MASTRSLTAPGAERAMADVPAVVHALEPNRLDAGVGRALRLAHGLAQRRDTEHTAARGHRLAVDERRTCVEYLAFLARRGNARDDVAFARRFGIAGSREHDAECGAAIPLRLDLIERALDRMLEEL